MALAISVHILKINVYHEELTTRVDAALRDVPGVLSSRTGSEGRTVVEIDLTYTTVSEVVAALTAAGYPATPLTDNAPLSTPFSAHTPRHCAERRSPRKAS